MKERLEEAPKYQNWISSLKATGNTIGQVEALQLVHKPNGELLFALLHADIQSAEAEPYPPVVMLRGHFVAIVVAITEEETGDEYFLLVKQRRVSDGSILYEHPAGMLDQANDLKAVAQKEMLEETGLHIPLDQLHPLNDTPIYTSPGLLDEGGYLFYTQLRMPKPALWALQNKKLGAADEREYIHLHIATAEEVLRLSKNMTTLYATHAYLAIKT